MISSSMPVKSRRNERPDPTFEDGLRLHASSAFKSQFADSLVPANERNHDHALSLF
jgi:hypothetical protein